MVDMEPIGGGHYEILGVDPRSTPEQVERAYRFFLDMYGDTAVATYSLLDAKEACAERARIQQAYDVLGDPVRRHEYDVGLGLASPGTPLLPFPAPTPPPQASDSTPPGLVAPERPAPEVLPEPVTGAALRRFREDRGISLRDIAMASKVGVRFFEYIEGDRHAQLPATVYLRGFLQEYARVLGLDPRRTAEAYMSRLPK